MLDEENFLSHYLVFNDRQAGISVVHCPDEDKFYYNAYCIERTLLKELFSVEYEYLQDALDNINAEFGQWTLTGYDEKEGCGSCAAK